MIIIILINYYIQIVVVTYHNGRLSIIDNKQNTKWCYCGGYLQPTTIPTTAQDVVGSFVFGNRPTKTLYVLDVVT